MGAIRHEKVTHTGLLLFGREQRLSELCSQHQVHYVYEASENQVLRNDSYRAGLLNILELIEQAFTGPANPEQEISIGLFKLHIPIYPIEVVHEAVLNAVTYRHYSNSGEVLIRHTHRELVVTSLGGFLADITPSNILRHEPISRNRTLAEAFEQLRLVERAGIGRRRIFIPMLASGKRIPQAARSVLGQFARPQTGILERRGMTRAATYHLNKAVTQELLGKTAYTKTKGADRIRYREMVREFVSNHGSITPQECPELLGLGESPTAQVEVSQYRKAWSGAQGFLRRGRDTGA